MIGWSKVQVSNIITTWSVTFQDPKESLESVRLWPVEPISYPRV